MKRKKTKTSSEKWLPPASPRKKAKPVMSARKLKRKTLKKKRGKR